MFSKLKTRNDQRSVFNNGILPAKFSRSPGTSSSVTKTNEATRLVRCKHCGWICDRERDIRSEDGSYTGIGISYGSQQQTGAYVGDTRNMIKLSTISTTSTGSSAGAIDETFLLYLKGNGDDGSTTITDSSTYVRTITVNNQVEIDTAQSVFGEASILFGGSLDYLSLTNTTDIGEALQNDFTFHLRVRFNSLPAAGFSMQFFQQNDISPTLAYFAFDIVRFNLGAGGGYYLRFGYHNGGTGEQLEFGPFNSAPVINTWYHYTFVVSGTTAYAFVDGVLIESFVISVSRTNMFDANDSLWIGSQLGGSQGSLDGWIDELILNNTAKWTSDFTPPIAEFSNDSEEAELGIGDLYYNRNSKMGGCPSCGSYLYDTKQPFQEVKFDV